MTAYSKPNPHDLVGVAIHAENPRMSQAGASADDFVSAADTKIVAVALYGGPAVNVYFASGVPGSDIRDFTAQISHLSSTGKVLTVLETLPTALLLQEKLGLQLPRVFPAAAWLSHRQYPKTPQVVRAVAGAAPVSPVAGGALSPHVAFAQSLAQQAVDPVRLARLALADDGFTALEWAVVEAHSAACLRGIHFDGDRARDLVQGAEQQAAEAAAVLKSFGFNVLLASRPAATLDFVRTHFCADVVSVSRKNAGLAKEAVSNADLKTFLAALTSWQHAQADIRDLAKIGPGMHLAHGVLRYGRARTGRLAGGGPDAAFNLQGMRKATTDSPARLRLVVVPPPASSPSREAVSTTDEDAPELASLDLKSIEPRVHARLAGQDDLLLQFRANADVYTDFAAEIGADVHRAVGKQAILGLGYGMGASTFWERLILAGLDVDLALAERVRSEYEEKYPRMVALRGEYWSALLSAAQGQVCSTGKCTFKPAHLPTKKPLNGVAVVLPSGRALYYWLFEATSLQSGHYADLLNDATGATRVSLYPGKLLENIVQAVARDILMAQVLELEAAGLEVPLTIHDEAVMVWRQNSAFPTRDAAIATAKAIMSKVPDSLPLLRAVPVDVAENTGVCRSLGD